MFPGQGAQQVGMGRDLADNFPEIASLYQHADEIVGYDLSRLCFEGPEDQLNRTEISQPALFVTSAACLTALRAGKIAAPLAQLQPDFCAGLSLGEYTALCYAGAIRFEDAVRLVRQRGLFMKEAGEQNPGAMLTLLGMERGAVADLVGACRDKGPLVAANFNSPGQIVLSGTVPAIEAAEALAKERGARRAIRLAVSGAFHSPLMEPAADKLRAELARTRIEAPALPLVSNVTARFVRSADEARDLLSRQLTSSVLWEDSMRFMIAEGVTEAVEVGPGRVLTGLLAKTDRNVATTNIGSLADLG